jgi:peroxiredoxin
MGTRRCLHGGLSLALLLGALAGPPAGAPLPGSGAPAGEIRGDYPEFTLTLKSGARTESRGTRDGRLRLPAGRYAVLGWSVRTRDRKGKRWEARGSAWKRPLWVRPGQVTSIKLASPITARFNPFPVSIYTKVQLEFTGGEGGRCTDVTVDGKRPPVPQLIARDTAGRTLGKMPLDYCCQFNAARLVSLSDGLPSGFTAWATVDFGPFPVRVERPVRVALPKATMPVVEMAVNGAAMDFTLPSVEGGPPVAVTFFGNQPVVVAFFCGCKPCAEVARGLARAPELAHARVYAVVADRKSFQGNALARFRQSTGFRAPILWDKGGTVAAIYQAAHCPRVWVADRESTLVYSNENSENPTSAVAAVVAAVRKMR